MYHTQPIRVITKIQSFFIINVDLIFDLLFIEHILCHFIFKIIIKYEINKKKFLNENGKIQRKKSDEYEPNVFKCF